MTDKPADTAGDRTEKLNRQVRENLPAVQPRDSATLILIDRAHDVPKVLLGRRHERHRFLPGKFVFPGGRIEPDDQLMMASGVLHETYLARLQSRTRRPSAAKSAAYALAAVRETYEETGFMLGMPATERINAPPGIWQEFAKAGILPDLSQIHFIARAITPPGRPLRFDSRFFAADVSAVARREDGFIGPDKELVELVWLPINEAKSLDMPGITAVALEELQDRIKADMSPEHPVPLYRMMNKKFRREVL
ncbi:MAG TPA: NUDIX hydrolase [Xanthobacteraceae bacterium]|jgi:8-oxo-dGTP pyrophosphatase MutT (NUDIX family)|nr:NUDIX hydrolase [Xanthobacteraceae bacterium]